MFYVYGDMRGKGLSIQISDVRSRFYMKHFEINLSIRDIQLLGGISYSSSKALSKKIKTARKIKNHQWLSLETFCQYLNVKYWDALELLKSNYERNS